MTRTILHPFHTAVQILRILWDNISHKEKCELAFMFPGDVSAPNRIVLCIKKFNVHKGFNFSLKIWQVYKAIAPEMLLNFAEGHGCGRKIGPHLIIYTETGACLQPPTPTPRHHGLQCWDHVLFSSSTFQLLTLRGWGPHTGRRNHSLLCSHSTLFNSFFHPSCWPVLSLSSFK